MAAIVISVLLIAITFTISFTGFFLRFNILDYEFKNKSLGLAEACADNALVKLAGNAAYQGNEDILVGSNTCHIGSVANNSGVFSFKTQGIYPPNSLQKAYTNISVMANSSTLSIVSWDETPN